MAPKRRPFSQLQWKQRSRILAQVVSIFQAHCLSLDDANLLIEKAFRKCQSFLPGLALDNQMCAQLLGALGRVRSAVLEGLGNQQLNTPRISVAQLDAAVCTLPLTHERVRQWGYDISVRAYTSAQAQQVPCQSSSSRSAAHNVGGRPSKVHSKKCIDMVKDILPKYLKESERVAVVGHGKNRRMVLAQHLTKKRNTIFLAEPQLRQLMGKDTFRRIMRIHFPHVRNPRRLTDICSLASLAFFSVFASLFAVFFVFVAFEPGLIQVSCFDFTPQQTRRQECSDSLHQVVINPKLTFLKPFFVLIALCMQERCAHVR